MFRRHRADDNQGPIVAGLRAIGVHVAITSQVGDGFPDLVVSYRGWWSPIEVKGSGEGLTDDQIVFHKKAQAPIPIVETVDEAIAVVTHKTSEAVLVRMAGYQ